MGTDTPLAVLSNRAQSLFSYFKQLFAQVTNPPVDAIREEIIMAAGTTIGPERNLFDPQPESAHQIDLPGPVLCNAESGQLRALDGSARYRGFRSQTLPTLFRASGGEQALKEALEDLCAKAAAAVRDGCGVIILSDRDHSRELAPIPSLLACAAVHHHLLREATRTQTCLIIESGEPREVHDFCLLIGYGASAIDPYLALETVEDMAKQGIIKGSAESARKHYISAAVKGVVKVISKMGISTVQSYHGAQVFEAIGLHPDVVESLLLLDRLAHRRRRSGRDCRRGAAPPRQGLSQPAHGATGTGRRWRIPLPQRRRKPPLWSRIHRQIAAGGSHRQLPHVQAVCRAHQRPVERSQHAPRPDGVQFATQTDLHRRGRTRRSIVKRFKTGAMSYGSISKEAHETLAIAMNRLGGRSNTGEGGEDPERFKPMANGDSKRSAIKQVASGRFGVTSDYLTNASEIQIKMAQGAKPGEGGQLPGKKVYPWIAKVRHSTPGVGLISPPPHHDIYSIEDLAQLIHDLKNANRSRAHQRQAGGRGRRGHGGGRRRQSQGRRHPDQRL